MLGAGIIFQCKKARTDDADTQKRNDILAIDATDTRRFRRVFGYKGQFVVDTWWNEVEASSTAGVRLSGRPYFFPSRSEYPNPTSMGEAFFRESLSANAFLEFSKFLKFNYCKNLSIKKLYILL